jgi:hypothetical protein
VKFISHRGNLLAGQESPKENTVQAIDECICLGYEVEIDVWRTDEGWFLGHDRPENKVSLFYLILNCRRLWFHCKNSAAFNVLKWFGGFMHDSEPKAISLTIFNRLIWNHSSNHIYNDKTVCVMPELHNLKPSHYSAAYGVCSDDIVNIEYEFKKYQASRS